MDAHWNIWFNELNAETLLQRLSNDLVINMKINRTEWIANPFHAWFFSLSFFSLFVFKFCSFMSSTAVICSCATTVFLGYNIFTSFAVLRRHFQQIIQLNYLYIYWGMCSQKSWDLNLNPWLLEREGVKLKKLIPSYHTLWRFKKPRFLKTKTRKDKMSMATIKIIMSNQSS